MLETECLGSTRSSSFTEEENAAQRVSQLPGSLELPDQGPSPHHVKEDNGESPGQSQHWEAQLNHRALEHRQES